MLGSAVFRTGAAPGGALAGPWVRNSLWTAARAVPSLDLRCADNKSLVDATTGQNLVTFTRASSGTYVDSQGVIQRAVTNLLLRSEEFNDASWTKNDSSITANAIAAPNGTLTGDKLVENTANAQHLAFQVVSGLSTGATHTYSFYAKAAERTNAQILFSQGSNNALASANLSAGTISAPVVNGGVWTGASATITLVGDGWYRMTLTATIVGSSALSCRVVLENSPGNATYTGNGTSGIYVWGAQLEQSTTVGEYIPTTSTINSAPRFDHNPTTGESLGLLVEEQRTNLLLRSEEFNDSSWSKLRSTITANAITAPNGTQTADLQIATSVAGTHKIFQSATFAGQTGTASVYAKAGGYNWLFLVFSASGDTGAYFNLSNGTIGTVSAGYTASITSAGDGWYRCSVSITTTSASWFLNTLVATADGTSSFTGNDSSGIYLWGAQLEAGAFPTSYIPTTTATVTRSADVASITGSNFGTTRTNLLLRSEEFDQSPWTLFGTATRSANAAVAPNGTLTADSITLPVSSGIYQGVNGLAGITYTFSVWIRAASAQTIKLLINTNLSDPTSLTLNVTTEWQRFSVTKTTSAGTNFLSSQLDTGGGNTFFVWGAQLEVGAAVTPYIPSPSVFVSRASSGTYIGGNGVLQTATTNLLLRSEEFDNASWNRTGILAFGSGSVANAIAAPNGTVTADFIVEDTTTGRHRLSPAGQPVTNGLTYTCSIYAKSTNRNLFINCDSLFNARSAFNLQTGAVTTGIGSAVIQNVGDGWYRCSVTGAATSTQAAGAFYIQIQTGTTDANYTGDGTSGIYIWGAQLEQSSTVGEYIPTTSTINSAARYDHDPISLIGKGLLLEESRTNLVRNNTMVGAVAGTPGTLPTNWAGNAATDLTREVVGTGTENGIAYIDFKFTGTVAASRTQFIFFETSNQIAASNGQSWTGSAWAKIVAGSLANITSVAFQADTRDASLVYVSTPFVAAFTPTSTFTRYSGSGVATGATIAWIQPFIRFITASSGAIDITLRIGLPQLEQGAFATSVIPTTTAAVTRAADVSTSAATSVFESSWYRQDEGTVFTDCSINYTVPGSSFPLAASLNDGTSNNRIENGFLTATLAGYEVITGGATQVNVYPNAASALSRRLATGYRLNDFAASINGGSINADTSGTVPTVDRLRLGDRTGSPTNSLFGHIRRLTYWPTRLSNATLQTITQ